MSTFRVLIRPGSFHLARSQHCALGARYLNVMERVTMTSSQSKPFTTPPNTTAAIHIEVKTNPTSHIERTAAEPRGNALHNLTISHASYPNPGILLLRLSPCTKNSHPLPPSQPQHASNPISTSLPQFSPGQWIDLFLPGLPKPGGFTITNSPAQAHKEQYLELAVQKSAGNPAAAWLWGGGDLSKTGEPGEAEEPKDKTSVLGRDVTVRVGGSFVWPPPSPSLVLKDGDVDSKAQQQKLQRVVFIAGGVGINPLMSMLSHITELKATLNVQSKARSHDAENVDGKLGFKIVFLYSSKHVPATDGEILFLSRLKQCFDILGEEGELRLFLTGKATLPADRELGQAAQHSTGDVRIQERRITPDDVRDVLGPVAERGGTVFYACGVPTMTDTFVKVAEMAEGMRAENVLCERWW